MSEQKHTPGPWTYSRWDEHGYTKFYVSQQEGAPYTPEYSDVADLISETVSGERVAIQQANARLISAAPDLFEAVLIGHRDSLGMPTGDLLAAANCLRNNGHHDLAVALELKHAVEQAAIAKATGSSHE
jgi:hypothetical protein